MRRLLQEFPQKFGSYVLLAPLGEGGMGAVYLAMSGHREMETLCVVKRMLPALRSQPEHVRRFRHEADLARQLVHGTLAHTHNIGEVAGEVFLVQEFVEGHDVSALLDRMAAQGRSLPVAVAVYIVSEIARGLAYAHDFENLNLVHRDINPPNVRLTYAGEVKLLDFGIASSDLHGDPSHEHRAAGKLWHLAPEQLRPGTKIDRRTDIYALGVLLWELLTQRPVGTRVNDDTKSSAAPETEGEILMWISRGEHARPSQLNPEVTPELDAVVGQATNLDPAQRFATADDLRRALRSFVPPEVHPEAWLAMALKEMFSPDEERGERRRLVEAGRHLLEDGPDRRAHHVDVSVRPPPAPVALSRDSRWRWLIPVGVGALVGMATLFWLRLAADRASDGAGDASPAPLSPGQAVPAPMPAPASVSAEAPPPAPTREATTKPAVASRPASPDNPSRVAEAKARPVPTSKRGDGEKPALAKADYLQMARDAFNARDWTLALVEGKRAVAAGAGVEALALVGNTYFKMGRFSDAYAQYQAALALEPGNSLLQERAGIARARIQEKGTAKEP